MVAHPYCSPERSLASEAAPFKAQGIEVLPTDGRQSYKLAREMDSRQAHMYRPMAACTSLEKATLR
jgi:hypothetical protein